MSRQKFSCPVCEIEINDGDLIDYPHIKGIKAGINKEKQKDQGQWLYFCSNECKDKFIKDKDRDLNERNSESSY